MGGGRGRDLRTEEGGEKWKGDRGEEEMGWEGWEG